MSDLLILAAALAAYREGESDPEYLKGVMLAAARVGQDPRKVYQLAAQQMPPGIELPPYHEITAPPPLTGPTRKE